MAPAVGFAANRHETRRACGVEPPGDYRPIAGDREIRFSSMSADTPIRPASTVVVLRDGSRGPEVFMVRRHHAIAFMAGAHVFPGGRVDPGDHDADESWCDGVAAAARRIPGVTADEA